MLTSAEQTSFLDRLIEEEKRRFLHRSSRAAEYVAHDYSSLSFLARILNGHSVVVPAQPRGLSTALAKDIAN